MPVGVAVDAVFEALADGTRRDLLESLADNGAASASGLAKHFPVTRQAIAKHLRVLEDAGLVERYRRGRELCFEVEPRALWVTARWLERAAGRWERHGRINRSGA